MLVLDEIEKGKFLASADLVGYYLKLKKDHPALISIEDGFDEKDYEGWIRMTEAFAKEHPGMMIVSWGPEQKRSSVFRAFVHRHLCLFLICLPLLCLSFSPQVGDDLYTTNTELIQKGVANKWANALLLKVNQIGTVSESMDAARLIFADKGQVIVSHRSGETINTLIADLAVAIGAGFIKTGAPARSERGAKYNRLLVIEELLEQGGMLA